MMAFLIELLLVLCHALRAMYVEVHHLFWKSQRLEDSCGPCQLSKSYEDLKPSYDVVVIGSGYGGSIAASRMARASPPQSVCLLERGEELWPGTFPYNLRTVIPELCLTGNLFGWIPIDFGKATGLYRWIIGRASTVLVGTGLGGTSLINAGVWLKPDGRVFESETWPEEIRRVPQDLDKYFKRAEAMLDPTLCPQERTVRKVNVLREQANAVGLGGNCKPVPLMTAFEERVSSAGIKMKESELNGQDCMGQNDGSKNSTLVTYLADAERWGAKIFCGCEVDHIEEHPHGGYRVYYRRIIDSTKHPYALRWIHARNTVVLGAGSVGTTEILLRSNEYGLPLSPKAGSGLASNGSMLAFGYNLRQRVNSVGKRRCLSQQPPGPTITRMIDCRDTKLVEQGFVIQDGGFPSVMALLFRSVHWLLPSVTADGVGWWRDLLDQFRRDPLQHSQVYLVLGHDNACGTMSLAKGRPVLDMREVRDFGHLAKAKDLLIRMTHPFGGTFKSQGVSVCVHPLGGMGMASDGTGSTGATFHTGQVLTGKGSTVHEGLIVADGSLMPMSLGANPVATICAFAERSMDLLVKRRGMSIDLGSLTPEKKQPKQSKDELISFSEIMEGSVPGSSITLSMTIHARRRQEMFEGVVAGTLCCPKLSKDLLNIEKGRFRLFVPDHGVSMASKMTYNLELMRSDGTKFVLGGKKTLSPAIAFSLSRAWAATTTMDTTIKAIDGHFEMSTQLRLHPRALLRELRTLRVIGPNREKNEGLLWDFICYFSSNVAAFVFLPLTSLQFPKTDSVDPDSNRLTRPSPDTQRTVVAEDGFQTPLRMWLPTGPANGKDLLLVPGGAVTHEIYALSTVRKNAIEYFTSAGYRCWCITHRCATVRVQDRRHCWTTYDARLDVKVALQAIREVNGEQSIFVIAHCVGSGAFAIGLLEGTIPSSWIRGIVASQFFLHPLVGPLNRWKARLRLVSLYRALAGDWYPCSSKGDQGLVQGLLNQCLRFYPHTSRKELCTSNLCQRTDLPFGRLWNHTNLNRETHDRLDELFTGVSTDCVGHLANMGLKGTLMDKKCRDLVTEQNVERLKGISVFLLVGEDNQAYDPEATLFTLKLLRARFGEESVRRKVFKGLGHLDCWMSDVAASSGSVFETVEDALQGMEE